MRNTSHLHLPWLAIACFSAFLMSLARAATIIENWPLNTNVPDNNSVGISDVRQLSMDTSSITQITEVTVTLNIAGGWAGDFFAYVVHDSGYAVLLNRIGRTSTNSFGNPAGGLQLTFADSAFADVHTAPSSVSLTGIYQPDGRTADPSVVLDTSPRSAMLASFIGRPAGGTWTLFVADVSPGSQGVVQSWGLKVTGVPEPGPAALACWALGLLSTRRMRRLRPPIP